MPFFGDAGFDIVFDGSCLHCIIGEDLALCLAEVRRILRPNGVFIVSTMCGLPRSGEAKARFDSRVERLLEKGTPYRTLKPLAYLLQELTGAGFRVESHAVSINSWWDHATIVCRMLP